MKALDRNAGDFVRLAKCIGRGQLLDDALHFAQATNASEAVEKALRRKTAPATTGGDTWGHEVTDLGNVALGFIDSIRPRSIFYTAADLGHTLPMRQYATLTAMLPAQSVGEGAWFPVVAGGFEAFHLEPRQTGAIVVGSKELFAASDSRSFAALRRELQRGAIAAADDAFLGIATEDMTPATATADPLADLKAMLDTVNSGAGSLLWALGVKAGNAAATAKAPSGNRLFPEMGPQGGSILNAPAIVSDRIAEDRAILIDASGFVLDEGTVDIDRAESAALQMTDSPAGEPAELVSLFQRNLVALRVKLGFAAERLRADAVAVLDGVPEGWTA